MTREDQDIFIEIYAGYLQPAQIATRLGVTLPSVLSRINRLRKLGNYKIPDYNVARMRGVENPPRPCERFVIKNLDPYLKAPQLAPMLPGRSLQWIRNIADQEGVQCLVRHGDRFNNRHDAKRRAEETPEQRAARKGRAKAPNEITVSVRRKPAPAPLKPQRQESETVASMPAEERVWIRIGKTERQVRKSAVAKLKKENPGLEIITRRIAQFVPFGKHSKRI